MTQQEQRAASQEYVLGFCFMGGDREVVLIHKKKPEWQAGMYNGVGGKIEPGEAPDEAMAREWKEETGTESPAWRLLVVLRFPGATIFVYHTHLAGFLPVGTTTDEQVCIMNLRNIDSWRVIPNLRWMLPMALNDAPVDDAKAPHLYYL